jgi:hypothetical protein
MWPGLCVRPADARAFADARPYCCAWRPPRFEDFAGVVPAALLADERQCRCPAAVWRLHRLRSPRGGANARARADAAVKIPVDRGAGQSRLRSGQTAGAAADPRRRRGHAARRRGVEIHGVGYAGVKGFAGGFGRGALAPWGEAAIKLFVQEAVDEAMKLETALARLRTQRRDRADALRAHSRHRRGRAAGDLPYLGSSRLEEPINRYRVTAVFHGHAHRGAVEGRTATGIPVYNVAMPLLARLTPTGRRTWWWNCR